MRLNRVLSALALVVVVGVGAVWIEGYRLRLQQRISELHQQREALVEQVNRNRLALSEVMAPGRLIERLDLRTTGLEPPTLPVATAPRPLAPADVLGTRR